MSRKASQEISTQKGENNQSSIQVAAAIILAVERTGSVLLNWSVLGSYLIPRSLDMLFNRSRKRTNCTLQLSRPRRM